MLKYISKSLKLLSIPTISGILVVVVAAGILYAATFASIPGGGATTQVNEAGLSPTCQNITNNNALDLFVPTNSQAEWNSLVTNGAPNVALNTCTAWYLDADGDGYTPAAPQFVASSPGAGWSTTAKTAGDCNDSLSGVYPGGPTVCSGGVSYNGCISSHACYSGSCEDSTQCSIATVTGTDLVGKFGGNTGSYMCSQPAFETSIGKSVANLPLNTTYVNGSCGVDISSGVGANITNILWDGTSCTAQARCYGGSPYGACGWNGFSNNTGCPDGTYTVRVKINVR